MATATDWQPAEPDSRGGISVASVWTGRLARNVVDVFGDVGARWLERLPTIIDACTRQWSLRISPPLNNLSFSYVAPALQGDGRQVVLKIGVPNPELDSEIEALILYGGRGCVQLLAVDRERGALLLERLVPGTPLLELADDEEATRIAVTVMRQLWRPVDPHPALPTVARWAAGLARLRRHFDGGTGPLPSRLVEKAESLFSELLATMEDPVLLHGDLHHGNILRAERAPWLAIDPKGVMGEPAYEPGALLRTVRPGLLSGPHPQEVMARRADILAAELNLDRERLLSWGLAQAVLSAWWSIEDHGGGWEQAMRCAELIDAVMRRTPC
jgi:streptomycin 6-kinase